MANLSAFAYQAQVDAAYLLAAGAAANADSNYVIAQATAAENLTAATARANAKQVTAQADADLTLQKALAANQRHYLVGCTGYSVQDRNFDDAEAQAKYTLDTSLAAAHQAIDLAKATSKNSGDTILIYCRCGFHLICCVHGKIGKRCDSGPAAPHYSARKPAAADVLSR